MSIEVYPSDYSTRYELTHAISIQMSVYYNDIGKLTIVAPASDYNINVLKVGSLIYETERQICYVVVNTKCDTVENRITVNGYTTNWLINRRVIQVLYHLTNLETGIYALINNTLRGITDVNTAAVTGLTEATDTNLLGGQILDEVMPYLEEAQLGQKMIWNPSTLNHTFKIYKGRDLTTGIHAVVFSEEFGTAKELVINDDVSTLKNYAFCYCEYNNGVPFVVEVGTATGNDRDELWIDSGIKQEESETYEQARSRATAYATMELGQWIERKSFSVNIDPTELGVKFDLGDIVSCVSARFGVSFNARITGVKYSMDSNSTDTQIILGDPILTALGALKLNG